MKGLRPDLHVAHFHGLPNADEVRELVLDLLKKTKDAGLGDHDDAPPAASVQGCSLDGALAEVRSAARDLRDTAERLQR
jgi:hypothetical protein